MTVYLHGWYAEVCELDSQYGKIDFFSILLHLTIPPYKVLQCKGVTGKFLMLLWPVK